MIKISILGFILVTLAGCGGAAPQKEQTANGHSSEIQTGKSYGVTLKSSEQLTALANYYIKKEIGVTKPVFPDKPAQPTLPKATELTKGEYETTIAFKSRVFDEKEIRSKKIRAIEDQYIKDVKAYNKEVKRLTDAYNNEVAKKQPYVEKATYDAMVKAYYAVYGQPYLDKDLKYDADARKFYATVKSTHGGFVEHIIIDVPLKDAKEFQKSVAKAETKVVFDYSNGNLVLKKILIENDKKSYVAMPSAESFNSAVVSVNIDNGTLNLPASSLLSTSLALSAGDFDVGEVNYSKDPEIAKLQKQKYDLEKSARDKQYTLAKEKQLKVQREALEAQIAQLQNRDGGVNDIPQLLKKADAEAVDPTKWLFIIAIENYEYTDPVAYSANSGHSFKEVMKKRLGVPEKNIRTLINDDATGAKIDYKFKDMLRQVKSGDTVYFYYSGHGIPVPSQDNAPYMLAQDMNPAYMEDKRFKLQNIYKFLSDSRAGSVIAIVDSCFSGGTDNHALIKGVAATRIKPKTVTFDKEKMIVISAGSGIQYSNKYDAKSNRLFSYYVMRGLIDNNSDMQKLYDYVKSNVQQKSYKMGASYEQVPVYEGNIGLKL